MAFCEHCLKEIPEGVLCADCMAAGAEATPLEREHTAPVTRTATGAPQFHPQFAAPAATHAAEEKRFQVPLTITQLPPVLKPLGAWGFVGYTLLFLIPILGLIVALVCACGGTSRVCLKNYARGYLLTVLLLALVLAAAGALAWYFKCPLPQFAFNGFAPY